MKIKELRQQVYKKFDGHCSYCGRKIAYSDMQVDHLKPLCHFYFSDLSIANSFENLMPSCRRCNHYKRAESLESFRIKMTSLHERIQKIYIAKVAIDYGIVKINPWDGIFHFEKKRAVL